MILRSVADVWFPLFLNVCFQSSVLLLAAWIGLRLTRKSSAACRHPIAAFTLGALLLLPILALELPARWRITPPLRRTQITSHITSNDEANRASPSSHPIQESVVATSAVRPHAPVMRSSSTDSQIATA